MDLRGMLGDLGPPEPSKGGSPMTRTNPSGDTVTRMTFFDRLDPGNIFLSPAKCSGGNCGLEATTHTAGQYHEGIVLECRTEGPFAVVLYEDEDGEQQSAGPVPGFTPIRIKLSLGAFTVPEGLTEDPPPNG